MFGKADELEFVLQTKMEEEGENAEMIDKGITFLERQYEDEENGVTNTGIVETEREEKEDINRSVDDDIDLETWEDKEVNVKHSGHLSKTMPPLLSKSSDQGLSSVTTKTTHSIPHPIPTCPPSSPSLTTPRPPPSVSPSSPFPPSPCLSLAGVILPKGVTPSALRCFVKLDRRDLKVSKNVVGTVVLSFLNLQKKIR